MMLKTMGENIAYLSPLLFPSMYVLKLYYAVLKLEVNNSVVGGVLFPVIFRLVNLIFNISTCETCKTVKHVLTCEPVKLISAKNRSLTRNMCFC